MSLLSFHTSTKPEFYKIPSAEVTKYSSETLACLTTFADVWRVLRTSKLRGEIIFISPSYEIENIKWAFWSRHIITSELVWNTFSLWEVSKFHNVKFVPLKMIQLNYIKILYIYLYQCK